MLIGISENTSLQNFKKLYIETFLLNFGAMKSSKVKIQTKLYDLEYQNLTID